MKGHVCTTGLLQRPRGQQHIVHRFHFGHHHVTKPVAGFAHDRRDVVGKRRVVHRMNTRSHAGQRIRFNRQTGDQPRVVGLTPYRRAIFTVQRDIKDTGTQLLRHFSLQLQAFSHACFDAAVVVTDGQKTCVCLRTQQHIARVSAR